MDELFRLVTVRQPDAADPSAAVSLSTTSAFQQRLAVAVGSPAAKWATIKGTSTGFLSAPGAIVAPSQLKLAAGLDAFGAVLAGPNRPKTRAACEAAIANAFGSGS